MKLIAPNKLDIPAKCKLNIAKSTEGPECPEIEDNGGYTVHPVPAPTSIKEESTNNIREGGSNQKLILFNRGKPCPVPLSLKGQTNFQSHLSKQA